MPNDRNRTRYDERLTVPRTWWVICAGFGASTALVFLPYGTAGLLGGLLGGALASAAVCTAYGNPRLRVVAGFLVAGDAHIPLRALGQVRVLDPEEAQAWRTYKANPRAFMLLRGYIRTAVLIEVDDPSDPTPYLYLSTRAPKRLARALAEAREQDASG